MELSKTDHVLLFPFPAKGHIKPFLCLAQLLSSAGLTVTLLNTDRNHHEIAAEFPSIHFRSISDGLPLDEPVNLLDGKLFVSMSEVTKPLFQDLLISARPPVTCLITDVIFRFPIDVAHHLGLPVFSFCTFSARFLFLYFSIPNLLQDGQIPHPVGKIEQELHGVAGAEGLLRCKDLPGFWSVEDLKNYDPMNFVNQAIASSRTSGLIINSFDELEAPFLTNLSKIYNKIYTIGPIHSLLKNSHCGLWKEDHSCLTWLDSQASRSVIFVSFGSLVKITSSQLMAVWNGLVNSGKSFLLVLRSDVIEGDDKKKVVREIMEMKANGRWVIVSWAPQEEVLAHEAIGGFLTHSGWNSTLESVAAEVPMISCPQIGDQPSNCTWVTKVWKIGLSMEDGFDQSTVEKMVRSVMEQDDKNIKKRILELAKQMKDRVRNDGTSSRNLEILVEDIRRIKLNEGFQC